MARKRKKKEKQIEVKVMSKEEKLKVARERRIQKAGLNKEKIEKDTREEFRKYFTKLKRKINLSSDLEDIIWLHFKASGFDKKDKFEDGIQHFGYKL